jgi:hypothetical protein
MRLIDRKWTDLSLGWQAVQAFQGRLEAEFGRAVQVGYNQKFRRELTEWQKKRRIFIAMVVLAPLSLIGLCLAAFYFREVACVLAWWTMTVLVILVTLGVAGWSYIREMVGGRPAPKRARVGVSLTDRWWDRLAIKPLAVAKLVKEEADFPALLEHALPDSCIAVRDLFPAQSAGEANILLLGPSGIWLFETRPWSGKVIKQDGVWKQTLKRHEVKEHDQAPDAQWLEQKEAIMRAIQSRLPHLAWTSSLLQGGVVFSHPKADLRKADIVDNTAPYGPAKAWLERVRQGVPDERLTLDVQLELLDLFITLGREDAPQDMEYASSKTEAERLYEEAAGQLREHVAKMVK